MYRKFFKANFVFIANRYEEWQAGRCISQGPISTEIVAEVDDNSIHFNLEDVGDIRILTSFDFEIPGEEHCILSDRIQYIHPTYDFNPLVPIVCNIFISGSTVQYVRFAMTNPDRLVEFYGTLVKLGQPSTGKRSNTSVDITQTAEKVLNELRGYDMVNPKAILEHAVKIYNDNANVVNLSQVKNIIESLKLFVKAYQLENEEQEDSSLPLKCKILMFIALCNYKIDNINQAYCIAKQGIDAIDEAVENSVIVGIPRSVYGEETFNELINIIEENRYNDVIDGDLYYAVDPEEIDTTRIDEIVGHPAANIKPTKEQIQNMIETISHVQDLFVKAAEHFDDSMRGFQIKQLLETFKMPLFFAWQGYKYGWHTDWCKEGDSLISFMMFEADPKKNTQELIDLLRTQSVFAQFERKLMITNTLISIYTAFVNDIENGTIKL